MNILLLAEVSACRLTGGASRMLKEQAIGLKERGHKVCLLVRAPSTDPKPQAVFDDIPEFRYAVCRKSAPAFVLSSIVQSIRVFDRIAAHVFRPDVVMIHQSLAGFGPILFRRKHAPAWVYQCLSLAHEEYLSRNLPGKGAWSKFIFSIHAKARLWIERWTIHRADRVVVMSEFMKKRVISGHGVSTDRIALIPGAADTSRFKPAADRKSLRARMRLPEDHIILFTVRNLVPRMGLENLIKAVKGIEKSGNKLLVIIGGEGPLRHSLEQLIRTLELESKVILKGFIPENDLAAWYQCADLVVMPTYALEGFGLVTVEALACGTPVLGTPIGATPEILGQIDPRLISKGNDAHSIAEALTNILALIRSDPIEWNNLSKKGLQRVAEVYNWGKYCENFESTLTLPH
ncbi:MAG: glycosyltransferase family 4 protein [Kiritimatiellae bacterium]|nr:glycosyltransferase family 4 protein [Kiritimatiellia bacterium]